MSIPQQDYSREHLRPAAFDELKRVVRHQLHTREASSTLSTSELVQAAYFKLAGKASKAWQGRLHFFGAAARAMREVLIDFAGTPNASQRGGVQRVKFGLDDVALEMELQEIVAFNEALNKLGRIDAGLRQVADLRCFAALSDQEIAQLLGMPTRTVQRDWRKARTILVGALGNE
ncbi:MAG TPA: ECF-type sigma factor [Longimicrobiales bacterium]|nr:ECF-type sigma factor [Longimicrobiales bacterium]